MSRGVRVKSVEFIVIDDFVLGILIPQNCVV